MLSLISMLTPRLVSSTLTFPCSTNGAMTCMMSFATLRILSRCRTFSAVGAFWLLYLLGYNMSIGVWVGLTGGLLTVALMLATSFLFA